MKNALLILLLLTPALFADKKPKRNVTVKDSSPTGIKNDVGGHLQIEGTGIKTDIGGHLMVEHTGIKNDIGGHLMIESTGIVTVWADSWPPPKTENDNEANVLIVKALNSGISSGKIKLKKPPLTPEQRAERAKLLLQTGAGLIGGSSDDPKEKPPTKSDR
jgi:hypothetical protein